jgi:hypothetical protein
MALAAVQAILVHRESAMKSKALAARGPHTLSTWKVLLLVAGLWCALYPGLLWALGYAAKA